MNARALELEQEISGVVEVVEQRTLAFLRDELALSPHTVRRRMLGEECLTLRTLTAIVGVGAKSGLYIAYSYDRALARELMKRYTQGLSISPEEEDLYARESVSDIVNVIVGNCTAALARRGELVTLSPPVLLDGGRTIQGRTESTIALLTLHFESGVLDVAFVGPRILFDDQLNYREGRA